MPRLLSKVWSLSLLTVAVAGCRDSDIRVYRVPHETPPEFPVASAPQEAPADMASTPVPTAGGEDLLWFAPGTWTAGAPAAMRKGTYIITGSDGATAELSITAFPGDVGGDLANVNRWRGQLGLAPIGPADLSQQLARHTVNGLQIGVTEMVGTGGGGTQRVIGAIVPHAGSTWFFKLTGPDALVAAERDNFMSFLQTLRAP